MPQIWLTYDELAALMECDQAEARGASIAIGLDRRRCRDGHTRAKLTPALTEAFLDAVLRRCLDQEIATCANDLRAMSQQMAESSISASKFRSAATG
jgi:hypothetical protein